MNSQTPPRISLRDIGKRLGLSHSTISLALRNHPRISTQVREKIQATAQEMGYQPDPMLAALAHYRQGKQEAPVRAAIAWLNYWPKPDQLKSYREFENYWHGASKAAEKFGYHLEEFVCADLKQNLQVSTVLRNRGITGILIPPQTETPNWGDFPWENFSIVRLGRSCQTPRTHLVTSDHVSNSLLAIEKIREKGYRRIGFIDSTAALPRLHFAAGFLMAQFYMDPTLRLPPLTLAGESPASDRNAISAWIKKNKPDAILTDISIMRETLEKIGLRVPDDIGLAVHSVLDGKADAGIDQNSHEIGRVALLMMMSLINDHARGIPPIFRQILVEGTWQDGSTLPDRKSAKVLATLS